MSDAVLIVCRVIRSSQSSSPSSRLRPEETAVRFCLYPVVYVAGDGAGLARWFALVVQLNQD